MNVVRLLALIVILLAAMRWGLDRLPNSEPFGLDLEIQSCTPALYAASACEVLPLPWVTSGANR